MTDLASIAALCSEATIIIGAAALLIKPIRHDMLHTYYRHREDKVIRQYELEDFLYLYRGYKALGGNSFIDKIKGEIDEWEVRS